MDKFIKHSELVHKRLKELRRAAQKETVQEVAEHIEELASTIEELDSAIEELAEKNDELVEAQEEISLHYDRYKNLFDFAPDGLVVTDENGKIQEANKMASKVFGISLRYLKGKPLAVLIENSYHGDLMKTLHLLAESESDVQRLNLKLKQREGKPVPVEVTAVQTFCGYEQNSKNNKQKRKIIELRWSFRDITARVEAAITLEKYAKELENSNIELENFAFVAAHHLKEPSRTISMYSDLLQENLGNADEDTKRSLNYIINASSAMMRIVEDLLSYSKLDPDTDGEQTEIAAGDLVETAVNNLDHFINEKNAVVRYGGLPVINGRSGQLVMLFQNLIANGIKFNESKEPNVSISAKRKNNQWIFAVKDNGIGIEKKFFDRIFLQFRRLWREDQYPGTGIGLPICKKIVKYHNGDIWLESKPGKGSTFYFTLPVEKK